MSDLDILKNCKKFAIMGGTFDPIHYGHLVTAETVCRELGLEKVLLIPSGRPPHKQNINLSDNEHRYLMTAIAAEDNPDFVVSRMEIDRPGMTYTVDTLRALRRICPKRCEIYFITGADAALQISTWKTPEELPKLCKIVVVTRPGYDRDKVTAELERAGIAPESVVFMDVPALDISSTDIRNRISIGRSVRYLLPPNVEKYIQKNSLYVYTPDKKTAKKAEVIIKRLQKTLSGRRFIHTKGVAEESVKLARVHGADEKKAYIAGLLHDCAKDIPNKEKIELCKKYGVPIDKVLAEQPDLLHQFLGAELAKNIYGIVDKEILDAIRCHTTGRPDMDILEKIIYLADFFEPSRRFYEGRDEIRALAYKDLDKAVAFSLKHTIEFNEGKKRLIHPLGKSALEFYKKYL